jgi:N,N'-diacetylchitobiose transport system permease protein
MVNTSRAAGQPGGAFSPAGRPGPGPVPRTSPPLSPKLRAVIWIRRHKVAPYLLLIPSLVLIAGLVIWPSIQIGVYSFQNVGLPQVVGAQPTQWVGFSNYSQILHDPEFWLSLRLSVISAAIMVPATLIVGTLVGLLLSKLGPRMRTFVASVATLAWATPPVSSAVVFIWLSDPEGGVLDWSFSKLPSWLGGGSHWSGFSWTNAALPAYTLIIALVVWTSFPFIAISVLAGLRTIPAELHESARVDGAGPWRIFWRVTYPVLKPLFLVLLLLSIIWDFGIFTQVYLIIGGLLNRDEFNLGVYGYSRAFTQPPAYSIGSALAFILTVILLIITVGYVRASVKQGAIQ